MDPLENTKARYEFNFGFGFGFGFDYKQIYIYIYISTLMSNFAKQKGGFIFQ